LVGIVLNETRNIAPVLLPPVLLGIYALIFFHLGHWRHLPRKRKILAAVLAIAQIGPLLYITTQTESLLVSLIPSTILLVLAVMLAERPVGISWAAVVVLGLLVVVGLEMFANLRVSILNQVPWVRLLLMMTTFPLTGIVAGMLVYTAARSPETGAVISRRRRVFHLLLAAAILGGLCYLIYWGSVWDHTSDGLTGLFLTMFSSVAAIGSGLVMVVRLNGMRRAAGFVYMLLFLGLTNIAFTTGWQVSYHRLTDSRAARIEAALMRYYERQGHYPAELAELVPRDLLVIQNPVIFRGESWCYQGEADHYRLGAIYREYFGLPISLRQYAAFGAPFQSDWPCADRLAEIQERYTIFSEQIVYPAGADARTPPARWRLRGSQSSRCCGVSPSPRVTGRQTARPGCSAPRRRKAGTAPPPYTSSTAPLASCAPP
jgi:hypothetical protein